MIKKLSLYTFALLTATVLFSACKKDYQSVQTIDDGALSSYLSSNNLNATQDEDKTGYYYLATNPQTSDPLYTNSDSVRYNVVIKSLLKGNTYSSTPVFSNLGTLVGYTGSMQGISVPAVRKVINKLRPGGSARIFLPSYLAFGKNGNVALGVPSNELIEIDVTTYAEKQVVLDDQHIKAFLTQNSLTATKDPSGVYYILNQAGTGTDPIGTFTDITVIYTGRKLDGTVFDSNSSGLATTIKGVIPGWAVLKNWTKGAKARIFIPSVLAYGATGTSSINANACLDFDIEISDVGTK